MHKAPSSSEIPADSHSRGNEVVDPFLAAALADDDEDTARDDTGEDYQYEEAEQGQGQSAAGMKRRTAMAGVDSDDEHEIAPEVKEVKRRRNLCVVDSDDEED